MDGGRTRKQRSGGSRVLRFRSEAARVPTACDLERHTEEITVQFLRGATQGIRVVSKFRENDQEPLVDLASTSTGTATDVTCNLHPKTTPGHDLFPCAPPPENWMPYLPT
jgi:hypothetical protein